MEPRNLTRVKVNRAVDSMTSTGISSIHLQSPDDISKDEYISQLIQQLKVANPKLLRLYKENYYVEYYKFEDTFHRIIKSSLSEVISVRGINVMYPDVEIQIRICVDGVDLRLKDINESKHEEFISELYDDSQAVLFSEYILTGDKPIIYREYFIV